MLLKTFVYPQDPFGYLSNYKDSMFHDLCYQEELAQDTKNIFDSLGQEPSFVENEKRSYFHPNPLTPSLEEELIQHGTDIENHPPLQQRRKRRRTRSNKNTVETENQRMTHIAVERNRRKQMNEYLAVLRSLMPSSYAQRGDQASIVGGAIKYMKELEHILQSLEPKRTTTTTTTTACEAKEADMMSTSSLVGSFSDFFTSSLYSTTKSPVMDSSSSSSPEIEVMVAESHANIKIMVKKKPRQLLKLVASMQNLRLTLLHLNITTLNDDSILSISAKVDEGSQLNTVDDIATALDQIIRRIQEDSNKLI